MVRKGSIRFVWGDRGRRDGFCKTGVICLLTFACVSVLAFSCWLGCHRCQAQSEETVMASLALPAGSGSATVSTRQGPAHSDPVTEICRHIYEGKFDVAGQLAGATAGAGGERVALLKGAIEQYDDLADRRQEDRAKVFTEQIEQLERLEASVDLATVESAQTDELDKAIAAASDDPNEPNDLTDVLALLVKAVEFADTEQEAALRADPFVEGIINASIKRSTELETEGKWLDAYTSSFYWLQAIDPNNQGYSDYADELLEKASIVASFQNSPCETREERYRGVDRKMFVKAIQALDVHYVNSIDYVEMGTQALNRCRLLAEVLTTAFVEELEDDNGEVFTPPTPEQVTAWTVALKGLEDEIVSGTLEYRRKRFLETMDKVLELNRATVNLPRRPLIVHFAKAALETLDPYTVMVWPREVEDFDKLMMNEFSGIGIEISKPHGLLTVGSLLPDTPAYRSGLDAGDIIESVDGLPTKDMSLTCAVKKITGPKGTRVTLAVRRKDTDEVETMTITRDKIVVPSIRGWQRTESGKWLYVVDEANRIGYIRVTSFSADTAEDFDRALRSLEAEGLKGLIVDLRFNTGGLLDCAVDIVDKFVKEGLIVRTQSRINVSPVYETAHKRGTHPDYPLVILINSSSASASEIVAGALADPKHERAVLVGTRTHGKGSVQGITPYPGGGAQLKYTMAYYHLPSNQRVKSRKMAEEDGTNEWGVAPDVEVTLTSEEVGEMLDAQRDNDVLFQARRQTHSDDYRKRTLEETLESDPQLAVGLLVAQTKLIEAGTFAKN